MSKQRLTFLFILLSYISFAQTDSTKTKTDIFNRITKSLKDFRLDTTTAPDDKLTGKILQLRALKGGFNIDEAIDFKIAEDRQKEEASEEALDKLSYFFKSGDGKRWLDNAVVWIYRKHFTYHELKQMVRFYKTTAGQKMTNDFPIIMLQSLAAAELIKDIYQQQHRTN
jgi:hypothetical protein